MTAEAAGIAVPEGFAWNEEGGYIAKEGEAFANKMYDAESGWMIGIDDGAYYDAWYGWQYDAGSNELVDLDSGQHYDMEYKPIHWLAGKRVFPGFTAEEAGVAVPEGCIWNQEGGYVTKEGDAFVGKLYDVDSGWMIGTEDGAYYDAWYGWQYDGATNELVDLATGNRYDLQYNPVSVAAE